MYRALQVVSCFCAGSFNTPEGMSLSFSSSLIPQLQMPSSEVPITLDQGVLLGMSCAWTAFHFLHTLKCSCVQ